MFLVKKLQVYFITIILTVSFLLLPFSWFLATNFNNPNQLENWINNSGLYQAVLTSLTNQVDKSSQFNSLPDKNLVKNYLNQAVDKSLSRTYFNSQINSIIRAYFKWLNNQTKSPNFAINLKQLRLTFVGNLNYESSQFINECISLVGSSQCRGLSSSIGNFSPSQFNQMGDFKFNQLTAQNLNQFIAVLFNQKSTNQPIQYSQLSYIPRYYRDFMNLRLILIVIIVIILLISFVLFGFKLKYLKVILKSIIISELLLIISLFLNNLIENNILNNKIFGQKNYGASLAYVLKHIFKKFNEIDHMFILVYLIFGVVLIIMWLIFKTIKRKHIHSKDNNLKTKRNNQINQSNNTINF